MTLIMPQIGGWMSSRKSRVLGMGQTVSNSGTTWTISDVNLGAPRASRVFVLGVNSKNSGDAPSAISVNGYSMTARSAASNSQNSITVQTYTRIWSGAVPLGWKGDIVVTIANGASCNIGWACAYDVDPVPATETVTDDLADETVLDINTQAGDFLFAAWGSDESRATDSPAWSGAEYFDKRILTENILGVGHAVVTTAETPRSVRVGDGSANLGRVASVSAVFR